MTLADGPVRVESWPVLRGIQGNDRESGPKGSPCWTPGDRSGIGSHLSHVYPRK